MRAEHVFTHAISLYINIYYIFLYIRSNTSREYAYIHVSATFDVGRDDGLGSRRNPLGVTLYEDLLSKYTLLCKRMHF